MANAESPPESDDFFDTLELPVRGRRLASDAVSSTKTKYSDSMISMPSTLQEVSTSLSKASTSAMKVSTPSATKDSATSTNRFKKVPMSRGKRLRMMAESSTSTLMETSTAPTYTAAGLARLRAMLTRPPRQPSRTEASTSIMRGGNVTMGSIDAELDSNPHWSGSKPPTPSQPSRPRQKSTPKTPSQEDQTASLDLSSPVQLLPSASGDNQSPSDDGRPYSLRPRRPVKYVTEMVSDPAESDDSSVSDSPKRNNQSPSPPPRHSGSGRCKEQLDFGEYDSDLDWHAVGGVDPPQEMDEDDDVFENGKAKEDDVWTPESISISPGPSLDANVERQKENVELGVSMQPATSSKGKRKRAALDDDERQDQSDNDTHEQRRQIQLDMEDLLIALKQPQEQFAADMVAKQNELFLRLEAAQTTLFSRFEERQSEIVQRVDALQARMEDERAARQNEFVTLLQTRDDALVTRFEARLGGHAVRADEMHRVEVERQKSIEARRLSVEAQRLAVEAQRLVERVGDVELFDKLVKGVEARRGVEDARWKAVVERQERKRAWEKSVKKALGVLATQVGDVGRDLSEALKVLGVDSPISTVVQPPVDVAENVGLGIGSAIPNNAEGGGMSTPGPGEQEDGSFAARVRKRRRLENGDATPQAVGDPENPRDSTSAVFGAGSSTLGRKSVLERLESMEMDMKECLEKLRAPMGNILLVKREPQAGSL